MIFRSYAQIKSISGKVLAMVLSNQWAYRQCCENSCNLLNCKLLYGFKPVYQYAHTHKKTGGWAYLHFASIWYNRLDVSLLCGIHRFVRMLISSEFTCGEAISIPRLLLRLGVGFRLQSLSSRKPAMISSTWRPFQECLENMRKSLNWWCGWFREYALGKFAVDTLELFL